MNGPDMRVSIGGLKLKNPVLTASGTYGFGLDYKELFSPAELGAVIGKGTTPGPRMGNYGVRLCETPSGLLNCIGLENPGADYFLRETLPKIKETGMTFIANISGSSEDDYALLAEKLSVDGVSALEVNVSCPNVKKGGMTFGTDPGTVKRISGKVREVTDLPVIVKLSPNVTDMAAVAKAAEEGGADAVSVINTLLGMAVDIDKVRPVLGNVKGGLSGPAVKPVAVRAVWEVSSAVDIPVIGGGGIMDWKDAAEFILAGASAVTVGTACFVNPMAPVEIIAGLREFCREKDVSRITELTGKAKENV